MPNWCNNELTIEGTADNVAKAKALIVREENNELNVDFNIAVPMPESVSTAVGQEWYIWSLNNWGTKWNVRDGDTRNFDGVLYFSTAWSQPRAWFVNLVDKLKQEGIEVDILLKYAEGGCMFGGEYTNDDDGDIIETEYDIDEIKEYLSIEEDEDQ